MAKRIRKPGWGRTFAENDRYKDDPIYWALYDVIIMRDPRAVFNIKGPHRIDNRPTKDKWERNGTFEESIDRTGGTPSTSTS